MNEPLPDDETSVCSAQSDSLTSTTLLITPTDIHDAYTQAPLPLDSQAFRLVELQPCGPTDFIKCRLRSYPLHKSPPYIALSYRWGRNKRHDDIELNGMLFPVGRSLWTFLNRMRLRGQFGLFWIDAICIQQSSTDERNHQVQAMGHIYRNAESVSVWLGETNKGSQSDTAMRLMAKYCRFRSPEQVGLLSAFCENEYWTRIWIIQKVVSAKEITIYYGSRELSWNQFQGAYEALLDRFNDRSLMGDYLPEPRLGLLLNELRRSPVFNVLELRTKLRSEPCSLARLIYNLCRGYEATDVRDKIYALLGLASDGAQISVDYSISPEELMAQVLSVFFTCNNYNHDKHIVYTLRSNLRILMGCELPPRFGVGGKAREIYELNANPMMPA